MTARKIRISAVRYANTYPFIYGLAETGFDKKVEVTTDHPADCAAKLISGKVDIGLIPVAVLPLLPEYYIISDFCLGAYGKVRTVMLLSNCTFNEINRINLDYRSRSSVMLARILAKNYWKRSFEWKNTSESFDFLKIPYNDAIVLIGDQCYEYENRFTNRIDLADEWYKFTGMPFVFACWTANRKLDKDLLDEFNKALRTGVNNIPAVVEKYGKSGIIKGDDLRIYLTENMSFDLDNEKREAIKLFLEYSGKL
ncbi:MAG: menaquinone biosynthesis protein [Bacteroidales bacterium]|nr:menaquinone biosynthesis protein [Bacteroidales bacterium]